MVLNTDKALATAKRLSGLLVSYSTLIIGILILVALIIWGTNKLTLNSTNCKNMNTLYDNKKYKVSLQSYISYLSKNSKEPNPELEKHRRIGDFYIKTAYNCCCAGNYKNDFVDVCALENCIKQGARCLDFEIYSVGNEPVVAASSVDDDTIKETYNSVHFGDAMSTISNMAFSVPENKDDPLLINLRIMSNNVVIYDKIAKIINDTLKSHLLPPCNAYGNRGKNASDIPIGALTKKVLIMADFKKGENLLAQGKSTNLLELINLDGNKEKSTFYSIERYSAIKNDSSQNIIDFTQDYMMMCLPDLDPIANNPNSIKPFNKGCQLVAMCFQKEDANLAVYHDKFNETAFIKKPENLLKVLKCIIAPGVQAPNYNGRSYVDTDGLGSTSPESVGYTIPLKKRLESKSFNPLKMSGISLGKDQGNLNFTV